MSTTTLSQSLFALPGLLPGIIRFLLFQEIVPIIPSGLTFCSSPFLNPSPAYFPLQMCTSFGEEPAPRLLRGAPLEAGGVSFQSSIPNPPIRSAKNAQKVTFNPPANSPLSKCVLVLPFGEGLGVRYSFPPSFPGNETCPCLPVSCSLRGTPKGLWGYRITNSEYQITINHSPGLEN